MVIIYEKSQIPFPPRWVDLKVIFLLIYNFLMEKKNRIYDALEYAERCDDETPR